MALYHHIINEKEKQSTNKVYKNYKDKAMFPELLEYKNCLTYSVLYKVTRIKKHAFHDVNEKSVTTYKSCFTSLN